MNIAYICSDFGVPVFGYKGASIHVREMVAAMLRAGHRVHVISPAMHDGGGESGGSNMGEGAVGAVVAPPAALKWVDARLAARLVCLSLPPAEPHLQFTRELKRLDQFLGRDTRLRQEVRNLLYNLSLQDNLKTYLQEQRIELIYERYTLFSLAGIRLARALGVPHILEVNAPLAYEQEKMRGLEMKDFARESEREIFAGTGRVIVVSGALKDFVVAGGVPEERVLVLPNAVDPQRFAAGPEGAAIRERLGLNGKTVIGFVGSLKPWHGTETLLAAFRELARDDDRLHLLIVGDGPGRAALEAETQRHGLEKSVSFTGNVAHDDIAGYIGAMDITAAPYIPNDNFYFSPIKIFEYMIMEKPVVGARIGQVEEILKEGESGLLFEPGNVGELAAALKRLSGAAALRRRLGRAGARMVRENCTWDHNLARALKGLNELGTESK